MSSTAGQSSGILLIDALGRETRHVHPQPAAAVVVLSPLRGRILLVEDGPDNQFLIERFLTKAGAQVEVAGHGGEALVRIEEAVRLGNDFDLIVTDMQMPEMDGYDMTRTLRTGGYERPIVALTAHTLTGDREKCLAAGCDDYLTKPVCRPLLISRCQYWLERRSTAVVHDRAS
ncbi:MAG TPA: response regulator [Phycisphaerales bacterium]|nr:response regulator [Phycisphaerales bacterium]